MYQVLKHHTNGITQYVLLGVWLLSLNTMSVKLVHIGQVATERSLLLLSGIPLYKFATISLSVLLWMDV